MKLKNILLATLGALLGLSACETEMMDYEGDPGVYFVMQKKPASGYGDPERYEYVDTTYVPFGATTSRDTVIPIRIRIIGDLADYDRYVTIKVSDASTVVAGEDYDALEERYLLKAGERQVDIPCHIRWSEKLALNPDSMFYLTVKLIENEYFKLPLKKWYPVGSIYGTKDKMINPLVHTIGINDQLGKPSIWNVPYWGTFSPTKLKLMCEVLNLQIGDFEVYDRMDVYKQMALGKIMAKYLREEAAAGRPIDDYSVSGEKIPMQMGPSAG